jgi:hypothetical protein
MKRVSGEIAVDRPLTSQEATLTSWLLEHGEPAAKQFLPQVARARVAARCRCGCASVDFAVDGQRAPAGEGMEILSDYQWRGAGGELFGVFVFSRRDLLSGLEVWSIDGEATPKSLPDPSQLTPLEIQKT